MQPTTTTSSPPPRPDSPLALLRMRPGLRRLYVADMVSMAGDWMSTIAVSVYALEQGEGALALAATLLLHTLPAVAAAPLGGWLADRFDRRGVLVGAATGATLVTAAMAWAASIGAGTTALLSLLTLRTLAAAIAAPASTAALPRLVERGELEAANTLFGTSWSVVFTLGIDAASFAFAALWLLGLPRLRPGDEAATTPADGFAASATPTSSLAATLRALRTELSDATLRRGVFGKAPAALAGGAGWIILNVAAGPRLGFGVAVGIGLLHAVRGIGTGVGPVLAGRAAAHGGATERLWQGAGWLAIAAIVGFVVLATAAGAGAVSTASVGLAPPLSRWA